MSRLRFARRIVVKIGSALLVEGRDGRIRRTWLNSLSDDVAMMRAQGCEVVIVTSGAIAIGRRHLGLLPGPLRLDDSQAAAAAGQARLVHAYQEALDRHHTGTAQVLLTLDDTEDRRRYINALNTLNRLLKLGVVPVVNENDTVATNEIRFGDNDRLSARVAMMASADTLILLSDIDGLYERDPRDDPDARLVPEVTGITSRIEAMAGRARSGESSGGMKTKLIAAGIAIQAGCHMVISNGHISHPLRAILNGRPCTWFIARDHPAGARKRWIAGALKPAGTITVDAGALVALSKGGSLLPAGVTAVDGSFRKGDAVTIQGPDGREVARGLVAYSRSHAESIAGHKSSEIERLLGYRGREELVHRDDLVIS